MSSIALLSGLYRRDDPDNRQRIRRIFIFIIGGLVTILALEFIFHLVISPRLTITRVEIAADRGLNLSDSDILALAGIGGENYFYSIDEAAIAERIAAYPPVLSAAVEKIFPNSLKISVKQRSPLVICLVEAGGETVPLVLDDEGVVFQIGASVQQGDLPVISGLTFAEIELGQRVHRSLVGFLKDLSKVKDASPILFSLISEVKFVTKNRTNFEVLLYPRDYRTVVRIGPHIDIALLKEILLVLDVFKSQGVDEGLAEIDFRTDSPMVRFREE
jgi:cell division protein FtsQ